MKKQAISCLGLAALGLGIWYRVHRATTFHTQGKILHSGNLYLPKTFDPIAANDVYSLRELGRVYEGLITYNPYESPLVLMPNILVELPKVTEGGCVYTCKLRKNVYFHDDACFPNGKGRTVMAADVVYSLKRLIAHPQQAAGDELIRTKIKGLYAWAIQQKPGKINYDTPVAGLKVLDRFTLRITLNQPDPQFLQALAMPCCFVVPREAVQYYGDRFGAHPVGTGPFVFIAYNKKAQTLTYKKHANYTRTFPSIKNPRYQDVYRTYTGRTLPLLDGIVSHIGLETLHQGSWQRFLAGKLDYFKLPIRHRRVNVHAKDPDFTALKRKYGIQQYTSLSTTLYRLVVNHNHALLRNKKLRYAISMAIDRERFNSQCFNGWATPAYALVPPTFQGAIQGCTSKYTQYDVARARQYLAEAGYPGGRGLPTLTLHIPDKRPHQYYADYLQQQLGKIGIELKVISVSFPELMQLTKSNQGMLHWMGWRADYPDARAFFDLLYGPYSGLLNESYYNNPVYNELYERAIQMSDNPQRTAQYEHLCRLAANELPEIPLVFIRGNSLYHGWVKNFVRNPFAFAEAYYDLNLKQRCAQQKKFNRYGHAH